MARRYHSCFASPQKAHRTEHQDQNHEQVGQNRCDLRDGDDRMVQWYRKNGFNPVALDANSIAPQLRLGMIDATPTPAFKATFRMRA